MRPHKRRGPGRWGGGEQAEERGGREVVRAVSRWAVEPGGCNQPPTPVTCPRCSAPVPAVQSSRPACAP
eukprot:353529-Chlamydomonas_euryale.AAC.10